MLTGFKTVSRSVRRVQRPNRHTVVSRSFWKRAFPGNQLQYRQPKQGNKPAHTPEHKSETEKLPKTN